MAIWEISDNNHFYLMLKKFASTVSLKFLQSHALFGGFEDEELIKFLTFMRQEEYPKGAKIVIEGDPGNCLFLIVEGSVEILKIVADTGDDHSEQIATLGIGETFGEMAIIDLHTRSATVRVLKDSIVLVLSSKSLSHIWKSYPKIYTLILTNLTREISMRLRSIDSRFAISLFSAKRK